MREADVIDRLRRFATHPAAAGLLDDAALFEGLVITHDSMAEGVHFFSTDPPASVGWKLVAVNLSDLAAKGAAPEVALLSLTLSADEQWDSGFLDGVEAACEAYDLALIGGDTIALPEGAPRVLGLTAIGRAGARVPKRQSAMAGDRLWLVGTLGDSAAGLGQLLRDPSATGPLVDIYRRPVPLIVPGGLLAPHANAMMDVSDGLLLDATRLARASGCSAIIDLDKLPMSPMFVQERGGDLDARLFAATGGDDYALLCALPPDLDAVTLSLPSGTRIACIGALAAAGPSLSLTSGGRPVSVPERIGHEHRGNRVSPMGDRR